MLVKTQTQVSPINQNGAETVQTSQSYLTELLYLNAIQSVEALTHEINHIEFNGSIDSDRLYDLEKMREEAQRIAYNLSLQAIDYSEMPVYTV